MARGFDLPFDLPDTMLITDSVKIPSALEFDAVNEEVALLLRDPEADSSACRLAGTTLPQLERWLTLTRKWLFWNHPHWGDDPGRILPETQVLVWQEADRCGVLLPLFDGDHRVTLSGDAGTGSVAFDWQGAAPGDESRPSLLAVAAIAEDPFTAMERAVQAAADATGTFRMRIDKDEPDFVDLLGWCTWDAFYQEVDAAKVRQGLESFQDGGIVPGFLILDDGWQDIREQQLLDFAPDTAKFPGGLEGLAAMAKGEFDITYLGVWHTLQGYWCGVAPDGPLSERYRVVETTGAIRPWQDPPTQYPLGYIHPDDIARFYQDFYDYLRRCGVDLTKVDNQSGLDAFSEGDAGRIATMRAYQHGLQGAAMSHLQGNLIHCMGNGSDIPYHMVGSTVWRNSDDYYPETKRPGHAVQQHHIVANAYNALWSTHFSLPDWDMFQTHRPESEFHAIARALSGGPVYISDIPGQQDFAMIERLVIRDNVALRPDQPAQPAADCVFVDVEKEDRLLKITNHVGQVGLMGLFHCRHAEGDLSDRFSPGEIPLIRELAHTGTYCARSHRSGEIHWLDESETLAVTLATREADLFTVSPVVEELALFGLEGKYVGAAAVTEWVGEPHRRHRIELLDGGTLLLASRRNPESVRVDGQETAFTRDKAGRIRVELTPGSSHTVELVLA